MVVLEDLGHLLGKLVLDSASPYLRDLVLGVGAPDLIGPLHLFGLNDQFAYFGFAIFGWGETYNEVCSFPKNELNE